jgi:hypothetical protein
MASDIERGVSVQEGLYTSMSWNYATSDRNVPRAGIVFPHECSRTISFDTRIKKLMDGSIED